MPETRINRKVISFFLLVTFSFNAWAVDNVSTPDTLVSPDSKEFLEMRGIIKKSKNSEAVEVSQLLDSVEILVYTADNRLIRTFFTNRKGKCDFKLPLDKQLFVKVSKKGFVSKYIEVNTKIPPDRKKDYIFPFQVDILDRKSTRLNSSHIQKSRMPSSA